MKRLLLTFVVAWYAAGLPALVAATTSGGGPSTAPQKILIEAAIIEVALDGSKPLDLQLPSATPFAFSQAQNAGNGARNGFGPVGKLNDDLEATLRALSRDRRVKILQHPRIETADGVPASLFVGRPLPASRHAQPESAGSQVVSGQTQPGITLEVAPSLQADRLVTMDLRLRVVRMGKQVMLKNVGLVPVTTATEAQAKIAVRDHETILLSGLMQEDGKGAAPALGSPKALSIPSAASRAPARMTQTEIMLLLRPTLLPADK